MLADTQSRLDICQTWCSNSGSHLPYPLYGYKLIAVAEAPLSPAQRMPYLGIQLDQSELADCGQLDSLEGPPVRPEREVDRMAPVILHDRHGQGWADPQ